MVVNYLFENTSDELVQSKLLILYILYKIDIPMLNTDITQYILEADYMDYFSVQQFLTELVDSKFIEIMSKEGNEYYKLSQAGKDTLRFFSDRIPSEIKKGIDSTYKDKKRQIVLKSQIIAHYFKKAEKEYIIILKVVEKNSEIFTLTLDVPSAEQAQMICTNWKENYNDVFMNIMGALIKDY